jgi:hypothetical protein
VWSPQDFGFTTLKLLTFDHQPQALTYVYVLKSLAQDLILSVPAALPTNTRQTDAASHTPPPASGRASEVPVMERELVVARRAHRQR